MCLMTTLKVLLGMALVLIERAGGGALCSAAVAAKLTCGVPLNFECDGPRLFAGLAEAMPPAFLISLSGSIAARLINAGERLEVDAGFAPSSGGGVLRPTELLSPVADLKNVLRLFAHDEPLVDEPPEEACVPYEEDINQSFGDLKGAPGAEGVVTECLGRFSFEERLGRGGFMLK